MINHSDRLSDSTKSDDRRTTETEAVQGWLKHTAEARGVSEHELMDQMLSSYWILDELGSLVTETASENTPHHSQHSSPSTESLPENDPSTDRQKDPPSNTENDKLTAHTTTDERLQEIHTMIQALIDAQQSLETQPPAGDNPVTTQNSTDTGTIQVSSELQRQIKRLKTDLNDLETQQETQLDRLSTELQVLYDRIHGLETQNDNTTDERTVEKLTTDINKHRKEETTQLEELHATDAALEAQIEHEFDTIEALFNRLLDSLEDLDSESESQQAELKAIQRHHDEIVDTLENLHADTNTQQTKLKPLQQRQTNQERLKDLKTEAWKLGIRKATCESCARKIDLTLLETPTCPNCSNQFTDINDGGWNPFRSPKLTTKPASLDEWTFDDS